MSTTITDKERGDLLETLAAHRAFLRFTVRDLDDEQVRMRTTVSELSLGAVLKHVAAAERRWATFIEIGPGAIGASDEAGIAAHREQFRLGPDDTAASLLATYESVARATDDLVARLPDLDDSQPLPEAPWFEPGARWSARRVLLHVIAETAQHAGHADIIREALDGAKTMG
ncbi:MAG: DinB family protein [Acidimicrobiales bacterium]